MLRIKGYIIAALIIMVISLYSADLFKITEFKYSSGRNNFGGRSAVFQRKPSKSKMTIKNKQMTLKYDKQAEGWCGWYTIIKKRKEFFDASEYKSFVITVKGKTGGELFQIGIADKKWDKKGDSIKSEVIDAYTPGGITTEFKTINIPLSEFKGIDFSEIASAVINFPEQQKSEIIVKDFGFSKTVVVPEVEVEETITQSRKTTSDKSEILVWDFEKGNKNYLDGAFNEFKRSPSSASVEVSYEDAVSGEKSLKISYDKKEDGWCGCWMHLFDFKQPKNKQKFFDATQYKYLSFKIKRSQSSDDFMIQLADRRYIKLEDSKEVAALSDYIDRDKTEWQEALIPLDIVTGLDMSKLGGITFNFTFPGKGTVYIEDIKFKKEKLHDKITKKEIKPMPKKKLIYDIAMWVWDIKNVYEEERTQILIDYCNKYKINNLFLQIDYEFKGPDNKPDCVLRNKDDYRRFIKTASKNNILVHALDGYKEYALKEFHPKMYAQVNALIEYNKESEKDEKFYGIHHDNEPYLLDNWNNDKNEISKEYIELCDNIIQLIKKKNSDLKYGVDIPFWYEERNEKGGLNTNVEYNGKTQPASFHIIDIVDNVGIMDYRNFAQGADGIIVHGIDEIKYADKLNKHIWIGLETYKVEPLKTTFFGKSEEDLKKAMYQSADAFSQYSSFKGFALHYYKTLKEILK